MPGIPSIPSLSLGFGGGPSQATNTGGPQTNIGYTGPFSAGSGRGGNQTNTNTVTQPVTAQPPTYGPFNAAGDGVLTWVLAGVAVVGGIALLKRLR